MEFPSGSGGGLFGHIGATTPLVDRQLLPFMQRVRARELEMFIGVAAQDFHFGFVSQGRNFPYGGNRDPVRTSGEQHADRIWHFRLRRLVATARLTGRLFLTARMLCGP